MSKADQIRALRAKAADTSLSDNEREVSRKMADKLVKKHGEPPKAQPTQTRRQPKTKHRFHKNDAGEGRHWVVDIKTYATKHPEYKKKLKEPLESWGCKIYVKASTNTLYWAIHNKELAGAAQQIMNAMALEMAMKEREFPDPPKRPGKKKGFWAKVGGLFS